MNQNHGLHEQVHVFGGISNVNSYKESKNKDKTPLTTPGNTALQVSQHPGLHTFATTFARRIAENRLRGSMNTSELRPGCLRPGLSSIIFKTFFGGKGISYKTSHHRIIPNFSRHLLPCHRSTCFCNFSFSASKRWHLEPKLESPKLEKLHALLVEDASLGFSFKKLTKQKPNISPQELFLILAACMFAESSQP